MGKKKSASGSIKATGSKQERARAAAATNPVPTEDVARPAKAPKAGEVSTAATPGAPFRRPVSFNFAGVGRNDICPCGSGKRFKNCHGH
ncbi:MAG TPA: SEC-C metal-binding domain-containing protein [Candidatus Dormibacteraeota bacterium]|jgi:preprotein translocase subunit SecA